MPTQDIACGINSRKTYDVPFVVSLKWVNVASVFVFVKLIADEFRSLWLLMLCYPQAMHTQKQGKQFTSNFYVTGKLLFCNSSILLIEDVNLIGF